MFQSGDRVDGLTVIFDMEGVTSRVLWRPGDIVSLQHNQLTQFLYNTLMTFI